MKLGLSYGPGACSCELEGVLDPDKGVGSPDDMKDGEDAYEAEGEDVDERGGRSSASKSMRGRLSMPDL